jgi:hypothetical protein
MALMRLQHLFIRLLLCGSVSATALTGCGGSAGNSQLVPVTRTSTAAKGTVNFVVAIPNPPAVNAARRPAYVSPATQSMAVTIVQGSTTVLSENIDLTPTSSNCSSSSSGTTCTFTMALNPGSYTASITTYDGTNGTGNALSLAQLVPFAVVADQANQVSLTLNGIPRSIVAIRTSATTVIVEAKDADGYIIIGAGSPTFTAAQTSGPAIATITQPTTSQPNLISFALATPSTYGTEMVGVTASYPQGTNACLQTGAICTLSPQISVAHTPAMVFATNSNANDVLAYTLPLSGATQTPSTFAIDDPVPMAKDADDDVFVATSNAPTELAEIAPPYTAITLTNTLGGSYPYGMAVAPDLDVLVTVSGGAFDAYAAPYASAPSSNATGPLPLAYAVATDATNNAYVTYASTDGEVCGFAAPFTAAPFACTTTATKPYAALVSGSTLLVGELSGIEIFSLPLTASATPIATLSSGVSYVKDMALDASGDLWVANAEGGTGLGSVEEFAAPLSNGESPSVTLSMPSAGHASYDTFGVALDSQGNLYVLNALTQAQSTGGGLLEFTAPVTSSSTPAVVIETSTFNHPTALTTVASHFTVTP